MSAACLPYLPSLNQYQTGVKVFIRTVPRDLEYKSPRKSN